MDITEITAICVIAVWAIVGILQSITYAFNHTTPSWAEYWITYFMMMFMMLAYYGTVCGYIE